MYARIPLVTSKKYQNFVFFSAGPIGDHVLLLDVAHHFHTATGIPSKILVKNSNQFINDLSKPYQKVSTNVNAKTFSNKEILKLLLQSIFVRNCFILFFPIPAPLYLKFFAWWIRFCTCSRIVGFNLQGTRSFPLDTGYVSWLGEHNTLPLRDEPFTLSANRMLSFLGYAPIEWVPHLLYTEHNAVFEKYNITKHSYIVFHITPSGWFRSLPSNRWNSIIREILDKTNFPIIFSGGDKDRVFIEECLLGIDSTRIQVLAGVLHTNELLTIYQHAKVAVVVQTGNGLIINMQHVPTVIVNIKGTTMFDYSFNTNAINLYSKKDCTCNPFETECTVLPYKGRFYMACILNLTNEEIISAILTKYNEK